MFNTIQLKDIDNKVLFDALKARLTERFFALPSFGIVSGQSVASACYELTGVGQGPMRDLDVFVEEKVAPYCPHVDDPTPEISPQGETVTSHGSQREAIPRGNTQKVGGNFLSASFFDTDPKGVGESVHSAFYKITYSHFDLCNPDINWIRIKHHASRGDLTGETIISGFDINACQIAMDMEKQIVVWTEDFQDFLYQKELKATFVGTPMHTAVRICKKDKDLSFASLDLDKEIKFLQTARRAFMMLEDLKAEQSQDNVGLVAGNIFSHVYRDRYLEFQDRLSPYFSLVEKKITFHNYYNVAEEDENGDQCRVDVVKRTMYVLNPTSWCEKTIETLHSTFSSSLDDTDKPLISVQGIFNTLMPVYRLWAQKNKEAELLCVFENACSSKNEHVNAWMKRICLAHSDSLKQISPKHIESMASFVAKHPVMAGIFSEALAEGLPFNSIKTVVRNLRWLEKNKLGYYIGWLERNYFIGEDCSPIPLGGKVIKEHSVSLLNPSFRVLIKEKKTNYMKGLSKNRVAPTINNIVEKVNREAGYQAVRELVSELDLFREGEIMGHCVGGYFNSISEDGSVLVHILAFEGAVRPEDRSTAQFFVDHDDKKGKLRVRLQQNRSKGNAVSPDACQEHASRILKLMEEKLEQLHKKDAFSLFKSEDDMIRPYVQKANISFQDLGLAC
jgi:hypothetical protein